MINFEQFSQGNSFLHRTDTRAKIVSCALLTLILALCQNFSTALAGLLLGVVLLFLARLSLLQVSKRLLLVNGFTLFLWLMLPLTYSSAGQPMADIAGLELSLAGIRLAALITLKSNAIILLFISLTATSTVAQLGHALQRLRLSPRLCMLLLFSYRYLTVIHQEYQRLYRAATLRAFSPATNLHTYKTFGNLLGMLLVKSWNRAERVQQAMVLRGFSGRFYPLYGEAGNRSDGWLLSVGLITGAIGLLLLEFWL